MEINDQKPINQYKLIMIMLTDVDWFQPIDDQSIVTM